MSTQLEGRYRARAQFGTLTTASTGTEQVVIDFVITEDGPGHGSRLPWYGFFTEKTFARTIESLRHLGWEGDDLNDLTGIDANEVELDIGIEEYTNKNGEVGMRSRVNWVNRAGGPVLKGAMDAGQAADFARRMRGRVLALRSGTPTASKPQPRPAPKQAPAPAPAYDDDIPF